MNVPFVDLKAQYLSIKPQIDAAMAAIFDESQFIGGHWVKDFENAFAHYLGAAYCISCANGTDSLEMALTALGIGKGDEVIVPAVSWISTSSSVSSVGAKVVFADVKPQCFTIDPTDLQRKITPSTKAIIPVHLYGMPANMEAIMQIANEFNLKVIEDCAQSVGAQINGKMTGTFGDIASFSFYPTKNLGAYGDAGALVTNNLELANKLSQLANHGQRRRDEHLLEGRNSRLDTLQAALLLTKLPFLNTWNHQRMANAAMYNEQLSAELNLAKVPLNYRHVYHIYAVQVQNRDRLVRDLLEAGIQTGVHFPSALPFLEPYKSMKHLPEHFPVAFKHALTTLSLPIYPEITPVQIQHVAQTLIKLMKKF